MLREIVRFIRDCLWQFENYYQFSIAKKNYDHYWEKKKNNSYGLNSYQLFRLNWVTSRVLKDDSMLDVGCGDGSFCHHLLNLGFNNISGADLIILPSLENNLSVSRIDLRANKPFKGFKKVDHIMFFEVLEHLPDSELVLNEALSYCRKSVFLSIPNTGYLPYRLRLLFGRFPRQWRVFPGEHLRFWTLVDFKDWMKCFSGDRFFVEYDTYQGLNVFKRLLPNLFSAAIICQVSLKK
jgi:SAM-dependent methyltransferase